MNSCASNAVCAAFSLEQKRQAKDNGIRYHPIDPSRLFVFYNSRFCDDATDKNTGISLRIALLAVNCLGVCKESEWPYDIDKFTEQPPPSCYKSALGNKICKYERLDQDIQQFRACLKSGFPFVFGIEIYDSFYDLNDNKGIMPMPTSEEIQSSTPDLHAVLAVGYDDTTELIITLNSWGKDFGDKGYFYIPYKFITEPKRAYNFWKIEKVSEIADSVPSNKKKLREAFGRIL